VVSAIEYANVSQEAHGPRDAGVMQAERGSNKGEKLTDNRGSGKMCNKVSFNDRIINEGFLRLPAWLMTAAF